MFIFYNISFLCITPYKTNTCFRTNLRFDIDIRKSVRYNTNIPNNCSLHMFEFLNDTAYQDMLGERFYMSRREIIARRKRQQRIHGIISISALILSIIIVFSVSGLVTNARSTNDKQEYKYFMSYEVEQGDSLWSIASAHCDEHYESVEDYMEEICIINSLSDESHLITGNHLIIPYYSYDFKY